VLRDNPHQKDENSLLQQSARSRTRCMAHGGWCQHRGAPNKPSGALACCTSFPLQGRAKIADVDGGCFSTSAHQTKHNLETLPGRWALSTFRGAFQRPGRCQLTSSRYQPAIQYSFPSHGVRTSRLGLRDGWKRRLLVNTELNRKFASVCGTHQLS
jgi:hypothetical protein